MITLGVKAKDKVTGFEGIVTGRAEYLYGCEQYCINPKVDKAGKVLDAQWFDVGRIEIIGKGIAAKEVLTEKPGGPQRDAPQRY
jgi:hypothetical protein